MTDDPYQTRRGKLVVSVVIAAAALFMIWGFLNSIGFEVG